jgi:hypothetical protein
MIEFGKRCPTNIFNYCSRATGCGVGCPACRKCDTKKNTICFHCPENVVAHFEEIVKCLEVAKIARDL